MKRGRIGVGVALIVLAVPVVVLARGRGFEQQAVPSGEQVTVWGTTESVTTNSQNWQAVPTVPAAALNLTPPAPLYLSVDLSAGKAKFRVVDEGGDVVNPSSVLVDGKGVSTATFAVTGEGLEDPTIEWKRKGDDAVEAASVIASIAGEQD